jgi:hypothetical protein
VLDESAFFRDETSATPDEELYAALVPSMANIPGALRLILSSPYSQRGLLHLPHSASIRSRRTA